MFHKLRDSVGKIKIKSRVKNVHIIVTIITHSNTLFNFFVNFSWFFTNCKLLYMNNEMAPGTSQCVLYKYQDKNSTVLNNIILIGRHGVDYF